MLKQALKLYKKGKLIYLHFPVEKKECVIFNGFFWSLVCNYSTPLDRNNIYIYSKNAGIIKEDYT